MEAASQNQKWSFCKQKTRCATRRRPLTSCLWLIRLYIWQHFTKIFITKTLLFFIFLCKYVISSSVRRYNLKVYMSCLHFYLYDRRSLTNKMVLANLIENNFQNKHLEDLPVYKHVFQNLCSWLIYWATIPANIYLLNVNSRNNKKRKEINDFAWCFYC